MAERKYSRVADGLVWRCPDKRCRTIASLRKGSFFDKAHIPLIKVVDIMYLWSMEVSVKETTFQVQLKFSKITCQRKYIKNM